MYMSTQFSILLLITILAIRGKRHKRFLPHRCSLIADIVHALYARARWTFTVLLLLILTIIFLDAAGFVVVTQYSPYGRGCIPPSHEGAYFTLAAGVVSQGVILGLTLYKCIHLSRNAGASTSHPIIQLMLRDGVLVFLAGSGRFCADCGQTRINSTVIFDP